MLSSFTNQGWFRRKSRSYLNILFIQVSTFIVVFFFFTLFVLQRLSSRYLIGSHGHCQCFLVPDIIFIFLNIFFLDHLMIVLEFIWFWLVAHLGVRSIQISISVKWYLTVDLFLIFVFCSFSFGNVIEFSIGGRNSLGR